MPKLSKHGKKIFFHFPVSPRKNTQQVFFCPKKTNNVNRNVDRIKRGKGAVVQENTFAYGYGRGVTAVWQVGARTEPERSRLRMLMRGKAWQYQALSVGVLFCGPETKTWIRSKPKMRKTMTIPTLIHHIKRPSPRDWCFRRKRSSSVRPDSTLSIPSLEDTSLAG